MRGWQQAGSESDNKTYPSHMPRPKTICTFWPMASQLHPHPTPLSPSSSPASLALSGYRCVIHRRSHSGALIGATGLNKGWHTAWRAPGQSVIAHSRIIWVRELLHLNAGHLITQNDLMGGNLTAHGTQKCHADKSYYNIQIIFTTMMLCGEERGISCISAHVADY